MLGEHRMCKVACKGLMKRTLPALKLQKSPLVLVLAQARIAPVLKMADYIDDIQERLRRGGLPRFSAEEDVQIQVSPTAVVQRTPRWEFQSKDQTRGVVITQEFIAVQTTSYNVYDDFEKFFAEPLRVLGEIAEPSLVQRIGLRYVDLIRTEPGQQLETYLKPGLHGLNAADIGARDMLARFEMLARTDVGILRMRCLQANDGSCFPPDLSSNTLRSAVAEDLQPGELVTMLDLDHFNNDPMDYDPEQLVRCIGDLHDSLDRAFRAAVTEEALTAWGRCS
jgi:uncharacterized protein (TIGR04255 family)